MLGDQKARDEFLTNFSINFSIIASPGTGKTTAIANRILNLIFFHADRNALKNYLVLTYTEKAANEIRERVYSNMFSRIENETNAEIFLKTFNNIFFGTIHGFCARFLREHHKKIKISQNFEIVDGDDEIWAKFIASDYFDKKNIIPREQQSIVADHFNVDEILSMARAMQFPIAYNTAITKPPLQNIGRLLEYSSKINESKVKNYQEDLKIWIKTNGKFPTLPKSCSKSFVEYFYATMGDYVRWRNDMEQRLINEYSMQYLRFKTENDTLGYDDLIALTHIILRDKTYRENYVKNYRIILDEAQDTDEIQFKILLNLADKNYCDIIFNNSEANTANPEASFSMVGDPKQSIYSERADVKFYMFLHDAMVKKGLLNPLNFNITMRCSEEIVSFVNKTFSLKFSTQGIKFVPMQTRPGANFGCVKTVKSNNLLQDITKLIANTKYSGRVQNFSDIAILAPRKIWLREIADHLKQNSAIANVQLWVDEDLESKPSLMKWTASILHFINNICDRRELVGILREIFGISTGEVVKYMNHGNGIACESIEENILLLKHRQDDFLLPNFVREIVEKFNLLARIFSLNIFSKSEIFEHFNSIMDAAYFVDASNLGYDALEKELIKLYKHPRSKRVIDKNSIQMLSFHKSKGLEWSTVIIPFMYREYKLMKQLGDNFALENEQRMLFVACTRAKDQLILMDDSMVTKRNNKSDMISSGKLIDSY